MVSLGNIVTRSEINTIIAFLASKAAIKQLDQRFPQVRTTLSGLTSTIPFLGNVTDEAMLYAVAWGLKKVPFIKKYSSGLSQIQSLAKITAIVQAVQTQFPQYLANPDPMGKPVHGCKACEAKQNNFNATPEMFAEWAKQNPNMTEGIYAR